jgi:hypothetical protein
VQRDSIEIVDQAPLAAGNIDLVSRHRLRQMADSDRWDIGVAACPQTPTPEQPVAPERTVATFGLTRAIGDQSFAFIPHRFLREGFFASLTTDERDLYFFLVLAADRYGVSFYHYETICSVLRLPLESYLVARNALIHKDFIAFDGTRFQVLTLPDQPLPDSARPLRTPEDFADHDAATIRGLLRRPLPPRS